MRKFVTPIALGIAVALAMASTPAAATWNIDTVHSVLTFKVRHLFSNSTGKFNQWSGTMEFDPADLEKGAADITIQAASISTANDDRDKHLRSPDFFDVEKFPTLTFKTTAVKKTKDGMELTGDLSIHGVTKSVTIPFEYRGSGKDPWGNTRAGFAGSLKINRKDFGLLWNKALDNGGMLLGDDVTIDIEVEAVQKKAS